MLFVDIDEGQIQIEGIDISIAIVFLLIYFLSICFV